MRFNAPTRPGDEAATGPEGRDEVPRGAVARAPSSAPRLQLSAFSPANALQETSPDGPALPLPTPRAATTPPAPICRQPARPVERPPRLPLGPPRSRPHPAPPGSPRPSPGPFPGGAAVGHGGGRAARQR